MKQLQSQEKMVESLLNLRNELARRGYSEIAFKINSCLFNEYPHSTHSSAWREKYVSSNWIKGEQNV